jgi:lysyl-tRNA synthetase, class II
MEQPKGREAQIINERIKKIEDLKADGVNPYAHKLEGHEGRTHSKDIKQEYSKLKEGEKGGTVLVAGRIMTKRAFGKLNFISLQDLGGTIQIVIQKDESPESIIKNFKKMDVGDIIGVRGEVIKTKTGEISVLSTKKLDILTKSIYPLPDKHKGLQDEEEKLRKRYLDIITNEDTKNLFLKKQLFWSTIRDFLIKRKFLEVETPVLENSAGGAAATPFATHHNALDMDVFLRISMGELWQKKLLVAGYEKTFEIGRQFRNEGMGVEYLQDYTQMEFYWAYANYEDGMGLVEEMYKEIVMAVLGTLKFEAHGHKIDLGKKWKVYDYEKLIEDKTEINIYKTDKKEIIKFLDKEKMDYDPDVDKWRLVDLLWKYCRKQISGPGFLTGQPVKITPLAKRSKKDPRKVEQFQVIIGGTEMGNGYSELNDPLDQEERFKEQRELGEAGDEEAMDHDEGFVEALKYGMPPACGFGVSERLFSYLMNRPIRECVMFPLMKPDGHKENPKGKSKDSKIAIAIINESLGLEQWEKMNTIAHLNAALGARSGKSLLMQDKITTKDGKKINLNIQHAIMIKNAKSNTDILNLIKKAKENDLRITEFTREMIETTNDNQVIEVTSQKKHKDIEYLGALIFGKKSIVEKFTKDFELYK